MASVFEKSAELIGRIAKSGLLQQEEDKHDTEPSNVEKRRAWAAELAGIPARRKKELPALAAAAEKARCAELEAWNASMEAAKAYSEAALGSMMAQSSIDGRENQLSLLLQGFQHPIVPDKPWDEDMPTILRYLHNVDDQVALMLETLRHACRATHERAVRDGWGRERLADIYNGDEIDSARQKLDAIRDALRLSMHQAELNPPRQRQEADDLLRKAEQIAIPLFQGSPAEDIFRRERQRLFAPTKAA